jgi:hypothetical protein
MDSLNTPLFSGNVPLSISNDTKKAVNHDESKVEKEAQILKNTQKVENKTFNATSSLEKDKRINETACRCGIIPTDSTADPETSDDIKKNFALPSQINNTDCQLRIGYAISSLPSQSPDESNDIWFKTNKLKSEFIFDRTLSHLYKDIPPKFENGVFISAGIAEDGFGDFANLSNVANMVAKEYPDDHIKMSCNFRNFNHMSVAKPPPHIQKSPNCESQIYYYHTDPENEEDLAKNDQMNQEKAEIDCKHASLIINVAATSEAVWNNLSNIRSKSLIYREYARSKEDIGSMGFGSFSVGGVFPEIGEKPDMSELQNSQLNKWLFDTEISSQEQVKNYFEHTNLNFAYIKDIKSLEYALSALTAGIDKEKNVDLITPLPSRNEAILRINLNPALQQQLLKNGVGKIIICNKDGQFEQNLSIDGKGISLRMIDPFPLTGSDFSTVMRNASGPIGCTGDMSLSEVIAMGSPIYYQAPGHKTHTMQMLCELRQFTSNKDNDKVTEYLKRAYVLSNYGNELVVNQSLAEKNPGVEYTNEERELHLQTLSMELGKLANDPEFLAEWKDFTHLLTHEFAFENVLNEDIHRIMAHQNQPELKNAYEELKKNFVKGSISLEASYNEMAALIKKIG